MGGYGILFPPNEYFFGGGEYGCDSVGFWWWYIIDNRGVFDKGIFYEVSVRINVVVGLFKMKLFGG